MFLPAAFYNGKQEQCSVLGAHPMASDDLLKKANDGDLDAMNALAWEYIKEKDGKQAEYWLVQAAEEGHILSMEQLGLEIYSGDINGNPKAGIRLNIPKAVYWLEKVSQIDGSDEESIKTKGNALYLLGSFLYRGKGGVPKDFPKAVKCYEKAIRYFAKLESKGGSSYASLIESMEERINRMQVIGNSGKSGCSPFAIAIMLIIFFLAGMWVFNAFN